MDREPDSNDSDASIEKLKPPIDGTTGKEKTQGQSTGEVQASEQIDEDCNDLPVNEQADDNEEELVYRVVVNQEQQFSIWPASKEIPGGWRKFSSKTGTMDEMKAIVDEHWTDMRPLSLKKAMSEWPEDEVFHGLNPEAVKLINQWRAEDDKWDGVDQFRKAQPPNELVTKLFKEQPVAIIRYCDPDTKQPDLSQLRRAIDLGVVLVKFTQTDGGTELGAHLMTDDGAVDSTRIQWSDKQNKLTLKGRAYLDYCPIEIHACVDLSSYQGTGYVKEIPEFTINNMNY